MPGFDPLEIGLLTTETPTMTPRTCHRYLLTTSIGVKPGGGEVPALI